MVKATMKSLKTKFFALLLVISLFTALSFAGLPGRQEKHIAQASFLDVIRALVTINPLDLDVSAPSEAQINKVFKVEAVASNKGEDTIENLNAEIFLPGGLVLAKKDSTQKMGLIRGQKQKKVSWSVSGEELGNYVISVVVSGELNGQIVNADDTTSITLIEKPLPPGRASKLLQNIFDFFRGLFQF